MHNSYLHADELSKKVIGAAIEVHRDKGPGLLESIYEWCLSMELQLLGHTTTSQDEVTVSYKSFRRAYPLRFDLLVDRCLLVEVKAVEAVLHIHKAQLLSYMKLMNTPIGLIINFNEMR